MGDLVMTGLERVLANPEMIRSRRWGLLANHAAVTADLVPARVVLGRACGAPALLLAPEHGLEGVAQDMEGVADATDPVTGAPVRSLYGQVAETLEPRPEDLADLEVVVIDLPDIGTRHYTFAATMDAAMAACCRAGVEMLVLDRPNPLGGVRREGGLVDPGFASFVSRLPVPIRHGLTLGEIAVLLQRERYPELELTVEMCGSWDRCWWYEDTGLPWVAPSPNMPTVETAVLYPGLCLVEATTLSEGRGTTRPFKLVGAPWVRPEALVEDLRSRQLAGVGLRAARFRPEFGKHAGAVCGGVELVVTDRDALEPVRLGLELLAAFRRHDPDRFGWRAEPYEFVDDRPAVDLLTGSAAAREVLESDADLEPLLASWRGQVEVFERGLDRVLLYR